MKKILTGTFAIALAAAAAFAAGPYDLENVRAADEELYREWSQLEWDNAVYGKDIDIAGLLDKYAYLADDLGLLRFIQEKEAAAPDAVERRRLAMLYRDLATTFEAKKVAAVQDELDNRPARDHVWVRGLDEPVPIRNLYVMLRRTDEEGPYMKLWYAANNYAVNALNPLRRERLRRHAETTQAMGYENYTDFYYQLLDYERGVPAAQARKFREDTFPMYKELVTARCRRLYGKDPGETPPWQSKNVYWGKDFDQYFPKEKSLAFTYNFYAGLGLDIRKLPNVTVDDEDRPEKEPRAACFPFSVPADVRVNLKPTGGADDYETAFHEFGHACHAAYTDPALPFELRMLGSNELTETYAIFFERMFNDRTFLVEELGMPADVVDDFLRYKLLTDMGSARGVAFEVIYDEPLHAGELDEPLAFYEALADEQRLFPKYKARVEAGYLNVDEGFYSLYYMAAFYAAAQLRAKLVAAFGPRWYKEPAAGALLKGLFRQGDSITVTEMLQQIGYPEGLNPDYLIKEFRARYEELK